ncbi:hypothetical protein TBR22_A03050 [Luteitalea sp. TBR-22]|uniref:serine/threonine-protein kinase n=1 Tax=Luteitalea sp. TBR-22 TaxID=2802971 RepID=UPI001AFAF6F7|nr:serine/threonine-protein kinase [Luteitalea sp. TBR-22]BCS31105.1 hypothetical protein TBR22_A03050 [Luteitalea sp. TBR-22]
MSDVPAIIGRYEVERLLGEGGMGVLYLARDPVIDRHVALKLLRVNGEDLRRRFIREAQSAGRLQHPNIVTVYDVGDHDGQLYIAMEYIDGDTLALLIRENAPFSPIRKLDIIDEVADGLGFAHQRGIVHRDIKPANLMISRAGLVKVLDFGIARVATRESGEMDRPTLIGTPAYMAPEQLEGAEVDARSDIYALGLVMYELFSGCRAFAGATTADVLQRVLAAQPTPLEQLVPSIDAELARIVARAMARQPADRYQDLQAMRKDLARARRRAMQASADDATMVVAVPASATRPVTPPATVVPPPPTPAPGGAATVTQEDRALAHLATRRTSPVTPPPVPPPAPARPADETVFAPVVPMAPPPVPLPVPLASGVPDEGPLPVPLPSVPSGAIPPSAGGRATVDAPAIAEARDRTRPAVDGPPVVPGPPPALPGTPASPMAGLRQPVAAAPPPLAAPGVVPSVGGATTPLPSARKGIPAAVLITAVMALLACCFVAAFVAFRMIGAGSLSGLFTRTVEPKIAGPVDPGPVTPGSTGVDATRPEPPAAPPAAPSPSTEVALDMPAATPVPEPAPATAAPAPPAAEPRVEPPPAAPVSSSPARTPAAAARTPPPATRQAPVRPVVPAPRQAQGPPPTSSATPRDVPREAPVAVEAPRVVERAPERREPEPPAAPVAPQAEGLSLVRAYVAARNTGHAAGIRRVWPSVDEVHLRRITSAFSAPLTLGDCDVDARDAQHAVATCRLTQAGTTGAYAQGQALTIRRTFVFDLQRDGRGWVIAGLRE